MGLWGSNLLIYRVPKGGKSWKIFRIWGLGPLFIYFLTKP